MLTKNEDLVGGYSLRGDYDYTRDREAAKRTKLKPRSRDRDFSSRVSMQVTRISIDGLWRCLCPSFNAIAASQLTRPLRASTRPRLYMRKQPSTCVLSSSTSSPMKMRLEGQDDATAKVRCSKSSNNSTSDPKSSSPYASLNDVPIRELHDTLRTVGGKNDAYKSITDLVGYLVASRGEKPSLPLYDALIRANADASRGSADAVATLLQEVKDDKIVPDSNLYHSALQALAIHPDYLLRMEVVREMENRWYTLTTDGWHYLIVGLLRDRQYEIALDKLEQMQREGIKVQPWLYDIFIYLFCEAEELEEALRILQYRVDQGEIDISANVWYYVLDACSTNYHYQGTKYVWQRRVETSYVNPPDGMCANVLNTAARHGDPSLATDVLRILTGRKSKLDIHHYECLILAYANSFDLETALQVLGIMKKAHLEPSEATTRPIFESLSRASKLPFEALKVVHSLCKQGKSIPIAAVNVVIEAFVAHGELKEAAKLYKALHEICPSGPNTATFNALLQGCSKSSGYKDLAMFLASEMAALEIRPDILTYDRLVLVCLIEDDYEDAFRYLEEMKVMFEGSELRAGTFNALIKKCTAAGDKRTWDMLEEMQNRGQNIEKIRRWAERSWKVAATNAPQASEWEEREYAVHMG